MSSRRVAASRRNLALAQAAVAAHGHYRRAQTHCHRGHPFSPANTLLYRGRRHCRACATLREDRRRPRRPPTARQRCRHGHRLRDVGVYWSRGQWRCKRCTDDAQRQTSRHKLARRRCRLLVLRPPVPKVPPRPRWRSLPGGGRLSIAHHDQWSRRTWQQLRRAQIAAHPDKGGTVAQFIAATARVTRFREREHAWYAPWNLQPPQWRRDKDGP